MKHMKKVMLILLAAAMVFILTGCGEKPAEEPAAETAVPAEESGKTLAERVEAIANDAGELAPFDADDLADMAGIQAGDYTDFVFLQGDVMEGREILALQAADEAAAEVGLGARPLLLHEVAHAHAEVGLGLVWVGLEDGLGVAAGEGEVCAGERHLKTFAGRDLPGDHLANLLPAVEDAL